jgi:hypothetical protein
MGWRPLRKVLRYRDQTGASMEAHSDHWAGFTWQAGPVIVSHHDGPWGCVQVWASSISEGKRVIRHAGAIAGVNPDDVGRWEISGTTNPRFGRSGTMAPRVLPGGYISVSKREGSDGWPEVKRH